MTTTIDSAGRLVIPKAIREAAGLVPGASLEIVVRDGVVEIHPTPVRVQAVRRGRVTVLEAREPVAPLTQHDVDGVVDALRRGDRG